MDLPTLKATVASYHEKALADLTKNGVDLFLVAANNARKNGEKLHTFEETRCTATLAIDGVLGGQLSAATITPASTFSKIKEVIGASIQRGSFWVPIDFTRADIQKELERSQEELHEFYGPEFRYPSDSQLTWSHGESKLVQRGLGLFIFPEATTSTGSPITVKLECYGFLRDYVAADLSNNTEFDFFLRHGDTYLQWACIDELNYIFHTYVPRQEGNIIPSPKDKRDEAWRDLVLWDTYQTDSHITRAK